MPRTSWFASLPGTITTQPLAVTGVPQAGDVTVYVGTAAGFVYALAANGYVRWRADLGRLTHVCSQVPDGFGVTGTPVADPATRSLYVADAFGRLHALDLATGAERPGWPVVLYRDARRELVWGASLLADGGVYVPTGSYCDMPMEGKVIRVDLATRRVSSWTSVPAALGGGGGIWGWGGVAYSARLDALFVATGNAFEGGSNSGSRFSEAAGYGEHLVELSPSLDVLAASDPGLVGFSDLDFVGSPVVADTARCGELVVAQAKNGVLFGWDAAAVAAGPVWRLKLQNADPAAPLLTQPTYSPALSAFYVVTASRLVRVSLDARCQPRLDWGLTLGKPSLYPSPTVAGGLVWVALPVEELSGVPEALLGVDARTGRVRVRRTIAGVSFAPPSALAGMLFVAGTHGLAATGFPVGRGRAASLVPGHVSRLDARHRWESREDGVYSTDDGGRHWRRISPRYADRVVRTSLSSGLIDAPYPAPACGCAGRRLWTDDGGRTWRAVAGIGEQFAGRGSSLYWWSGGSLYRAALPPARTAAPPQRVAAVEDGTIVDAAPVPGGAVALADRRAKPPQVVLVRGSQATVVTLPDAGDGAVPRSLTVSWPSILVRGRDFSSPGPSPDPVVEWRSGDGGLTWSLLRSPPGGGARSRTLPRMKEGGS
ncbi:MAG TPA: hypothetical protein VFA44_05050 [Gaiellaceae bacterium]|nr:hypothetical protein [Gaiellaceae bacterium]